MNRADSIGSVLSHYSHPPTSIQPLTQAGGFSGARLWRVITADGDWCLKAWPPRPDLETQLTRMHDWMRQGRAGGLDYIPRIRRTRSGGTLVWTGEWAWDMSEWMPGAPVADAEASDAEISAACLALARLHRVWRRGGAARGLSVAVQRRLRRLADLPDLLNFPEPNPNVHGGQGREIPGHEIHGYGPTLNAIAELLPACRRRAERELAALAFREFELHPCLADVWRDHVLLTDGEVTGIIDFGAARMDHPSVDLARLLGSLTCQPARFHIGITAYRQDSPLSGFDEQLVYLLDATGIVAAAMNWLDWLTPGRRSFDDRAAVQRRLEWTLGRLRQLHADGWN
ncbi:MAG: aminoglycoside phosphotransferase family protein [Gemmataceae bacterium]|nr:aminoglycoside phosphotransferase family protein [Gemmataceae bacterium]